MYPPPRDSRQHFPEHRPVTLRGFVEAVAHLHKLGSVPAHVLVSFIETTLEEQGRRAKGQGARAPAGADQDPAALLSCFYELRALCRWAAAEGLAPVTLLTTAALWGSGSDGSDGGDGGGGQVKEYAVKLNFSSFFSTMSGDLKNENIQMFIGAIGRGNHPVLGAALLKGPAADLMDDYLEPRDPRGLFGHNEEYGCMLRHAARHARAGGVEVVSGVTWDEEGSEVRLLLCEDDAAALRREDASVVLYRSDSYGVLTMPTSLAKAKEV